MPPFLSKIIRLTLSLLKILLHYLFFSPPKSGCRKSPQEKKFYPNKPKPPWVKKAVIRLKALMPAKSCRKLADFFNREFSHKQMSVGKTYVAQVIQKSQYEIQVQRKKIKNAVPKFVPQDLIWAVDLTGKTDASGNTINILGIVEHNSRMNLSLTALFSKSSLNIIHSVCHAIENFGKPKIIRTDNEACFTSLLFRFALFILGIKHQRSDKSCPWQNGRIERFFGTLKQKLNMWEVENRNQLNIALIQFRFWYNHIRTHQYLDGKTPAEVWNNIDIYQNPPKGKYLFSAWDGLLTGIYFKP